MPIPCKVIEDLLPNYVEGLTQTETNEWIDQHLQSCEECSRMLRELEQQPSLTQETEAVTERVAHTLMNRIRRQVSLLVYVAIGAIAAAIMIGVFTDHYIYSFLAFALLATALLALVGRMMGRARWYWLSGGCIYVFSALAGFTIGLYTVSAAFVLLALALGHSCGWIRRQLHSWLFAAAALALWGLVVLTKALWIFIPATIWFW